MFDVSDRVTVAVTLIGAILMIVSGVVGVSLVVTEYEYAVSASTVDGQAVDPVSHENLSDPVKGLLSEAQSHGNIFDGGEYVATRYDQIDIPDRMFVVSVDGVFVLVSISMTSDRVLPNEPVSGGVFGFAVLCFGLMLYFEPEGRLP